LLDAGARPDPLPESDHSMRSETRNGVERDSMTKAVSQNPSAAASAHKQAVAVFNDQAVPAVDEQAIVMQQHEIESVDDKSLTGGEAAQQNATLQQGLPPLVEAVMADDVDAVRALIAAKAPVNVPSKSGVTLLEAALLNRRFGSAQLLLEAGSTIDESKVSGFNAFTMAIVAGNVDLLRMLISTKIDVNITNKKGATPLLVAALNASPQIIQVLFDAGARFDPKAPRVADFVCMAAKAGKPDALRLLLSWKTPVDVVDKQGNSPLQLAVANRHTEVIRLLMDVRRRAELSIDDASSPIAGLSPSKPDAPLSQPKETNITPTLTTLPSISIFEAVATSNLPALRQLIAANADVNVTDADGQSALHIAIRDKLTDVISLLIEAGADVASGGEMGIYPLSFAAVHGDSAAVELLIAAGAPINVVNRFGQNALYLACQNMNALVAEVLLVAKADVNAYVPSVGTPLSVAVLRGSVDIMRVLFDAPASLDVTNNRGQTPLHLAAQFGHKAAAALLLERGVLPDVCDEDGATAVSLAVVHGKHDVLQVLLAAKADVGIPNNDGLTPLDLAVQRADLVAMQMLNDTFMIDV